MLFKKNRHNHCFFEGQFRQNVKQGIGRHIQTFMKDGGSGKLEPAVGKEGLLIYTGEWFENKPHGFGTTEFPNGDIYQGEYDRGEISGQGYLYKADEKRLYIGSFEQGHRDHEFVVRENVKPHLEEEIPSSEEKFNG